MFAPIRLGGKHLNVGACCGLLTFGILLFAWIVGFSIRLFSVIRFESVIHEFDPWFNYRATKQMVESSFSSFYNWFDKTAWYPLGRIVGGTVYPGLMITSGFIHFLFHLFHIPVHIREVCVFLAPFFSGMTSVATYLFTKEVWNKGAGLFAACFIAIAPGYISRSSAGSYDNEGIAIFALMFTYYLWIKSIKSGSVLWSAGCALAYFYMVSAWGGYVFIINLVPLHVFVLLLMNRYSVKIYVAYTTFFILGLLMSMQVPFVGFQPLRTSEHMASVGVFALLQVVAFISYLQERVSTYGLKPLFTLAAVCFAGIVFLTVIGLTYAGVIAPWSGRFYSLWDTTYAKIHIPIISSVSEHQPTSWCSLFFDMHILLVAFPAGVWLCFQNLTNERVFVVLYGIFASYFAGVMVRLILTLTPIVCVFAAISFSRMFEVFLDDKESEGSTNASPRDSNALKNDRRLYDKPSKTTKQTLQALDVDYVLVIFGGYIGYSGDDINKFLWMVRIGGGEHPDEIQERDYLTDRGEYRIDSSAPPKMLNSLMYKLSYYRFGEVRMDMRNPAGFDRTRSVEIGKKHFKLEYLEEAFTSEHWLVRIYRVLPPQNTPVIKRTRRRIPSRQSGKTSHNLVGRLNFNTRITRGKRAR
ncbi:unnamed protein product [Dicrocoelium dendriticum]|nr:unnamed protein product [Dicrocoelium dendriticum]